MQDPGTPSVSSPGRPRAGSRHATRGRDTRERHWMKSALPTRRVGAALGTLALATAIATATTPADAATPVPVLSTVTDPVPGIIGDPVPTGWLFDGSSTSLPDVRTAIGADTMWQRG